MTVVGGGVSGLTCGVALRRAGFDAHVIARERFPDTVSVVAAAIWTFTGAEPRERTRGWALRSRQVFSGLVDDPSTGVVELTQIELERHDPGPLWWESTPWVRRLDPDEVGDGYATGFAIDGLRIEPPVYLEWLSARFEELGGTVTIGDVGSLESLEGELIVNCTGLGARELVGDDSMYPIRGHVVAVVNPGIDTGIADESDVDRVTYVYPRSTEMVLGGAREDGRTDPSPDPATTARILADTAVLDPRVEGLPVLAERVGLRPGRPEVRLEAGLLADGRPVVHDYGHGGAGFILSWGCADEVVELAVELVSDT